MVPPVEIAPKTEEKSTEKMTDTRSLLLRLGDSMKAQENPIEKKKVVRATLQTLTKEQLAMAEAELTKGIADAKVEGADVPAIFKNPEEVTMLREGIAEETRARLSQASEEIETWYKPKTWSPQTKQKMEAVGWGVGFGVTAVALAMLWKATRKKAGQAAEAVGEKVGSIWDKMKWVIGGTLGAGLAYVGIRAFQGFGNALKVKNLLTKAEEELARLSKKPKEMMTAAEKKILETAEARVKALKQELVALEKNEKEPKADTKETPVEKAKRKGKEILGDPAAEEIKENVEEDAILRGMLLFEPPQSTWTASDKNKLTYMHDTLSVNGDTPIDDILAASTQPLKIKEGANDPASRKEGNLYLWNFCKKHQRIAEEFRIEEKDAKKRTLRKFLEKVATNYAAVVHFDERIRNAKGNIVEAMKDLDTKKILSESGALGKEFKQYVTKSIQEMGLSDEEIKQLNWKDLFAKFTSLYTSIGGSTPEEDGSSTSKVVLRLHEKLKNKETTDVHKYMLPFFHRVLPRAEWDPKDNAKNESNVHEFLLRMPMHQAVRCAFFTHLIKSGNPTGIVLMQAEILKYIADESPSYFTLDKEKVISRISDTLIGGSTEKLSEEFKTLNIDPTALEKGLKVLKSSFVEGAQLAAIGLLGTTGQALKQGGVWTWEHPGITGGAATTALTGKMIYNTAKMSLSETFLDYHKFTKELRRVSEAKGLENVYRSQNLLTERKLVLEAMDEFPKIFSRAGDMSKGKQAVDELTVFVRSGRTNADFINLGRELTKIYPKNPEIAQQLRIVKKFLPTIRGFRGWNRALSAMPRAIEGTGRLLRASGTLGVDALKLGGRTLKLGGKFLKLGGGRSLPLAGAAVEQLMYAWSEKAELQKQFDAETDPLKREVIRNEMFSKEKNYQVNYALALAYGMSPVGLGLMLANMARQDANESIVEGTKYMLQDRRDMAGKSAGNILGEIQKSSPGSMVTYGQWIASSRVAGLSEGSFTEWMSGKQGESSSGTNFQNMGKTFDAANTGTRSEAYAAYFKNGVRLPPISAALLTKEEAKDPERSKKRLTLLEQEQTNNFVQSALTYIARTTKNTFTMVSPELLNRAEVYAYECHTDWMAHMLGEEGSFTSLSWDEKEDLVTENVEGQKDEQIAQIQESLDAGESRAAVLPFFFITNMKEELALCETEILKTNYSDWGINVFNMSNHEEMQNIARAMFGEKFRAVLLDLCKSTKPMTRESFEADRQSLLATLKTNPDTLALEGFNRSDRQKLIDIGTGTGPMSMEAMLAYLELNTLPIPAAQPGKGSNGEQQKKEKISDGMSPASKTILLSQIQKRIDGGESKETGLRFFLMKNMKEDLAACEANIVKTNYSDWGWKVWDMSNHEDMQGMARVMFGEKMREALAEIGKRTNPITKESFEADRQSLLKILASDPDKLALEGFNNPDRAAIIEKAKGMGPLSMESVIRYLENPLSLSEGKKADQDIAKTKAKEVTKPSASDTKINTPTQAA